MNFSTIQPLIRRLAIAALSLCFAAGTLSASYHVCDKEPVPKPTVESADMAGMDCASMGMTPAPKIEKKCCIDFSCPKCFSSPLTTAPTAAEQSTTTQATLHLPDEVSAISHLAFAIDRPPKQFDARTI